MRVQHFEPTAAPMLLDAGAEFVATAYWQEWRHNPGYSPRLETVRGAQAESDSLAEVEAWAREQEAAGCEWWTIARTWRIANIVAPPGHRLHGKRDNATMSNWRRRK